MTISDENLDFNFHRQEIRPFLNNNDENNRYWVCHGQQAHALSVIDATLDLYFDVVSLGQKACDPCTKTQLIYGAARRTKFIWISVRNLNYLIAPNRTDPLPLDQVEIAARDLNDIYIHLRGCMDNYAWALRHAFGDKALKKLGPMKMHLFEANFLENSSMRDFSPIIAGFREWNTQLKSLRDPVAHRIPLSVTPAALAKEDLVEYKRLECDLAAAQQEFFDGIRRRAPPDEIAVASDRFDALYVKLQSVGTFVPMIVHDPDEGGTNIYPTVPQDIGMFIRLARALNLKIREKLGIETSRG